MERPLDEMLQSLMSEQREAVERRAKELIAEERPSQEVDQWTRATLTRPSRKRVKCSK